MCSTRETIELRCDSNRASRRVSIQMDIKNLLLWMLFYASLKCDVNGQLSTDCVSHSSSCSPIPKGQTSRYFTAYGLLPRSTVTGCAATVNVDDNVYRENHVISIQNTQSTMIYLTIRGVPQETTRNKLPQNIQYKYMFALYSNEDVKWIPVLENMPRSNVTYKFWYQTGSEIVNRVGLPPLQEILMEKTKMETNPLFHYYENKNINPFGGKLTSFSETRSSKKANITILAHQPSPGSESSVKTNCNRYEEGFDSPRVHVREYDPVASEDGCDVAKENLTSNTKGRGFILDMAVDKRNSSIPSLVHVEISGDIEKVESWSQRAVVVLKANVPTTWIVNVGLEQKSVNFLFLTAKSDKVEISDELSNAIHLRTDLDSKQDQQKFVNSVEKGFGCDVVSYVGYTSKVDLVFLRLDPLYEYVYNAEEGNNNHLTIIRDIGNSIVRQCDETGFYLTLSKKMLEKYGMLQDGFTVGNGNCLSVDDDDDDKVIYDVTEGCGMSKDGDKVLVQLKYKFRYGDSSDLPFDAHGFHTEDNTISCQKGDTVRNKLEEEVFVNCDGDFFEITIPEEYLDYIDLSELKYCNVQPYNNLVVYSLSKKCRKANDTCCVSDTKSTFDVPLFLGTGKEALSLSCISNSLPALPTYKFDVFSDFELENRVTFPRAVQLPGRSGSNGQKISGKTYHFKVSTEAKRMVFLQQCRIISREGPPMTIIENNCAVHHTVSFVRSYKPSPYQHFAVKFEKTLIGLYSEFRIQCSVGSYSYEDGLIMEISLIQQGYNYPEDPQYFPAIEEELECGIFNVTDESPLVKDGMTASNIVVPILLGILAFILGCAMILIIWLIQSNCCSKREPAAPRERRPAAPRENTKRCESNSSGSGSSHSTRSTRTDGSSKSFFCFKTEKETTPSAAEKQDNSILLKPLIDSPTSQKWSLMNNTTTKIIQTYPDTNSTSPASSTLREEVGCLKQDGRHLYVSAGHGYLKMPIKSAQVDPEMDQTGTGTFGCKSERRHHQADVMSSPHAPGTSTESSAEHPVLLNRMNKYEYKPGSLVGGSTVPTTSYQTTPQPDCTTESSPDDAMVDWDRGLGAVTSEDFDNLKEVDL